MARFDTNTSLIRRFAVGLVALGLIAQPLAAYGSSCCCDKARLVSRSSSSPATLTRATVDLGASYCQGAKGLPQEFIGEVTCCSRSAKGADAGNPVPGVNRIEGGSSLLMACKCPNCQCRVSFLPPPVDVPQPTDFWNEDRGSVPSLDLLNPEQQYLHSDGGPVGSCLKFCFFRSLSSLQTCVLLSRFLC